MPRSKADTEFAELVSAMCDITMKMQPTVDKLRAWLAAGRRLVAGEPIDAVIRPVPPS